MKPTNHVDELIGKQLRLLRLSRKIPVSEIAKTIGTDELAIWRYEKGIERPSAGKMKLLCSVLEVTPNDFYDKPIPKKAAQNILTALKDVPLSDVMRRDVSGTTELLSLFTRLQKDAARSQVLDLCRHLLSEQSNTNEP
jgi:transcriptional regulator with XRE-family HTH domain